MTVKPAGKQAKPEAQLKAFIDQLAPKTQQLFRAVRAAVRKRFPTANELVYDYGKAVVIGYAPGEHGIEAVVAIRGDEKGVSLYFNQGPKLPDPQKLLKGSAKQVRFIPLESASQLKHPDVAALIDAATEQAKVPLPAEGKGGLIIKTDRSQSAGGKSNAAKKKASKKATK